MAQNLSFNDIIPQDIDTFTLPDGTEIPFKERVEFTAVEGAFANGLKQRLENAVKTLGKDASNGPAAERLDGVYTDMVNLILPGMPDEVIETLLTGQKVEIITWWRNRQQDKYGFEGAAKKNGTPQPVN